MKRMEKELRDHYFTNDEKREKMIEKLKSEIDDLKKQARLGSDDRRMRIGRYRTNFLTVIGASTTLHSTGMNKKTGIIKEKQKELKILRKIRQEKNGENILIFRLKLFWDNHHYFILLITVLISIILTLGFIYIYLNQSS